MLESIQNTELGTLLYNACLVAGGVAAFGFGVKYRNKYDIPLWKAAVLFVSTLVLMLIWTIVHFRIESEFSGLGTKSIVRALPYLPLIIWPVSAVLKLKWKVACDFLTPLICLYLGISLFGCVFAGCCEGYPCKFGIYSFRYGGTAFPIQIIEAIAILGLFFLMLRRNKRQNYNGDGQTCPVMMILFGLTRILWEFFRNNEKILFGFSSIAFHALFLAIVGYVLYCEIEDRTLKAIKKSRYKINSKYKR